MPCFDFWKDALVGPTAPIFETELLTVNITRYEREGNRNSLLLGIKHGNQCAGHGHIPLLGTSHISYNPCEHLWNGSAYSGSRSINH